MTTERNEKINKLLLSVVCFTVYIALFIAALVNAFNTNQDHLLPGSANSVLYASSLDPKLVATNNLVQPEA